MKIQICLVSQQAAANLLPALDPVLKPQKVILVVTQKMQRQAENLQAVLRETVGKVELLSLSNEQDYGKIQSELLELAAKLEGDTVSLNITGGTKLMSVAAQSVAVISEWAMFYVDADTDQVIDLATPSGAKTPAQHAISQQLKLRHYLRSYGFELTQDPQRTQANAAQQQLTKNLATQVGRLEASIGALNGLAQDAERRNSLSIELQGWQETDMNLDVLLRDFENAGAFKRTKNKITFADRAARDFVKGGWLELHAIQAVHQATGPLKIRDKAVGLEVKDLGSNTKNELDIAFLARNRLFVIECKTARIDKPQGGNNEPPKANDTLFKLAENCRRIGGVGARGMLVSYRKLRDPELKLAKALNIEVVAGADIARLYEKIKAWVQPSY